MAIWKKSRMTLAIVINGIIFAERFHHPDKNSPGISYEYYHDDRNGPKNK